MESTRTRKKEKKNRESGLNASTIDRNQIKKKKRVLGCANLGLFFVLKQPHPTSSSVSPAAPFTFLFYITTTLPSTAAAAL
jgi:hypothetical protein